MAARLASHHRIGGYDGAPDNVLAEAAVRVWRRASSETPLVVHNPAAYGSAVITSVLLAVVRRRSRSELELTEEVAGTLAAAAPAAHPGAHVATEGAGDGLDLATLRRTVEGLPTRHAWLTAASLAYVDLAVGDAQVPPAAPRPRAGATPAQALAWAALWMAGVDDVFPGEAGDPKRRMRARRTVAVIDHLRRAEAIATEAHPAAA